MMENRGKGGEMREVISANGGGEQDREGVEGKQRWGLR